MGQKKIAHHGEFELTMRIHEASVARMRPASCLQQIMHKAGCCLTMLSEQKGSLPHDDSLVASEGA